MNNERTPAQDAERKDRAALAEEIKAAGATLRGNSCRCPFHEDAAPSAGIFRGKDDQVWHFKCHGCGIKGDVFDLRARRLGKSVGDVLAEFRGVPATGTGPKLPTYPTIDALVASYVGENLEHAYKYANPDNGVPELVVLRFFPKATGEKKQFRQIHFNGDGWVKQEKPGRLPLYDRVGIRAAEMVIVVEGEKCADAVRAAGFTATTSAGGAGKAHKTDWTPLAGKNVVLWPDHDAKGHGHMRDVAQILESVHPAPRVRRIDPDDIGLNEKGDAADYLAPCTTTDQRRTAVGAVVDLALSVGPANEVDELIADTISGKRKSLPLPWHYATKLSRPLRPGTVLALCGDPGCGKSLMTLETSWRLHLAGERVALYELEDDRPYHLMRVLAQVSECADVVGDDDWIKANADRVRALCDQHRDLLNSFGRCITCNPDSEPSYADLLEWIRTNCEAGVGLLVIDPVTAVSTDKPWVEDRTFILSAKAIVRKHGARLILVTHPKLNTKGASPLASMAGGAAFPRFAHTVLWIHHHDPEKELKVDGPYGAYTCKPNRTLRISKARNGAGTGALIAYTLKGDSLRFDEYGPVAKDQKNGFVKASIETANRSGPGSPRMLQDPFADEIP